MPPGPSPSLENIIMTIASSRSDSPSTPGIDHLTTHTATGETVHYLSAPKTRNS